MHPLTAHPRSRGEHATAQGALSPTLGSSPLARGARGRLLAAGRRVGLIPARAGSTPRAWRRITSRPAHPRSRGEHAYCSGCDGSGAGSSPLARGAHRIGGHAGGPPGLIPARAGSTDGSRPWWRRTAAHPRSRGEHGAAAVGVTIGSGSSPLAWGARQPDAGLPDAAGLIPARAGSTALRGPNVTHASAHPRSRGEHDDPGHADRRRNGSSPLARGAPPAPAAGQRAAGLISARAGSTAESGRHRGRGWAHPRSRGEHRTISAAVGRTSGSSPLARGALRASWPRAEPAGLIPARAGSTCRQGLRLVADRAHPRSRGEHPRTVTVAVIDPGSSPLARGAQDRGLVCMGGTRLIPARAGSTRPV